MFTHKITVRLGWGEEGDGEREQTDTGTGTDIETDTDDTDTNTDVRDTDGTNDTGDTDTYLKVFSLLQTHLNKKSIMAHRAVKFPARAAFLPGPDSLFFSCCFSGFSFTVCHSHSLPG